VQAFNLKVVAKKLKNIAGAMGIRVAHMTDQRGAEACIAKRLNFDYIICFKNRSSRLQPISIFLRFA